MTKHELPKAYDFKSTEPRIYEMWEKGGYFKPWNDPNQPGFDPSVKPFVISIPPPNVTGELHIGHAMFVAVEDLMIRYHRMKGIPSLWVPGTDHAGIATQLQVEKMLLRTEERTREEIGRDEFVQRTWDWKKKYGGMITNQIRRLGAVLRLEPRTLHPRRGAESRGAGGLCPTLREGTHLPRPASHQLVAGSQDRRLGPRSGILRGRRDAVLFQIYAGGGSGSNTSPSPPSARRPSSAIPRWRFIPMTSATKNSSGARPSCRCSDARFPSSRTNTSAWSSARARSRSRPGHDPNDYAIAQRHNLPIISMLDEAAQVNENGGPYQGQDRFEARKKLWADMKAAGLVIKTEPYRTTIPRSQRGGEIVEPMISTQWFVTIEPLAEVALAAVKDGRIKIVPEHFEKVYYNWLDNIKDWCISRQLWWGHRIPVWYCPDGHMTVTRADPTKCGTCGSTELHQDEDVLDTWFSSGLWPFSTLGWPEETPDYKYFYPTSYMETAYDILFFWVARMIMDGLDVHRAGSVPHRVPARPDPRRARQKDEQVLRQRDRPTACHG